MEVVIVKILRVFNWIMVNDDQFMFWLFKIQMNKEKFTYHSNELKIRAMAYKFCQIIMSWIGNWESRFFW